MRRSGDGEIRGDACEQPTAPVRGKFGCTWESLGNAPWRYSWGVPEKSPQKPASKKAGKSLKEKREAKREKKANGRSS